MILDLVILIAASASNLALGSLVFARNHQRAESRAFFGISVSITAWTICNYLTDRAPSLALDQLFARLDFAAGFLVLATIALFAFYFGNKRAASGRQRLIQELFIVAGTLFSLSDFIVGPVSKRPDGGTDVAPGSLYVIYPILVLLLFGLACFYLWRAARNAGTNIRLRTQAHLIMFGLAGFIILALLTNIVIPAITGNWAISRIGPLLTVFLVGSVSYAIVKHRLFDIRLIVARSVAYVLLLGTLTGLYGLSIFAFSRLFIAHSGITAGEMAIAIALALLLAVTFQPLRRLFEKLTDRLLFRNGYDTQVVLDNISSVLAAELLLDRLLERGMREICHHMRLSGGAFIILEQGKVYKTAGFLSMARQDISVNEALKLPRTTLVADELDDGLTKDFLVNHGIRVSLPLRTREGLVGYLFVSDKLNGAVYSSQDVGVLEILRKEFAIAIVNAKAYAEISRFNQTLQERVHEATHRLQIANRNLKVLDKAKDDFISMASHQLGTPLTAITGYLSMALDEDNGSLTMQQREYVNFALEAAERLVAMSSDLLNVSRLSAGRFMIQRQPVDLVQLADQEAQQLRPAAERKGLTFTFIPPAEPLPKLQLDESKTRQVIMNFIDNAIYYTEHGGVTLAIKREGKMVSLTVTDTGIGVPADEQGKLFAKFYRADNAKAERPDGTGLGLYLAKRVIEDQGGELIFQSQVGQGSTFGFRLPIATPAEIPRHKASE